MNVSLKTENQPDLLDSYDNALRSGISNLPVEVSASQHDALVAYLELMIKWNKAYNLTAVRDPLQMVTRHLLDSLSILPYLPAGRVLDVGTGGGLPGVVLAIMCPDREIHLLDSNGKKTRFLFQVKTALGLDTMEIHHERVERFRDDQGFDVIVSRAFASLEDMVAGCRHLLGAQGSFLAMKGQFPQEELAALRGSVELRASHELHVPGLNEQRNLLEMVLT
ncbi:MAG: 16S rRNA (guanine(527)-N(7))-methyltransferase RsmG [Halioglobus sp.]